VISAPVVNEPILGGSSQISGNFTVESANQLAIALRSGALPVDLAVVEERSVGPDLGADSIRSGGIAALVPDGMSGDAEDRVRHRIKSPDARSLVPAKVVACAPGSISADRSSS